MKRKLSSKQILNVRKPLAQALSYTFIGMLITLIIILPSLQVYGGYPSGSTPIWEHPITEATIVWRDGSTFYSRNSSTGEVSSNANDDTIIQAVIDATNSSGGGMVLIKQATYSASVTVKGNVLLLLEVGVTGVSYTLDGTGMVLHYSNGYVIYDATLNMTGHEVQFGAFHTGSSPPSIANTGSYWYNTTSAPYTLYIYNGTAWALSNIGPQGPQGAQGLQGLGGLGDYHLIVYQNSSNTDARFWNGTLLCRNSDDDSVINWARGNLTSGRTWYETVYLIGNFSTDARITIDSWMEYTGNARITLEDGSNTDVFFGRDKHNFIIDGLIIDANEDGNGNGDKADYNGIKLEGCYEFTIRNCRITSANRHGIVVERQGAGFSGCNASSIYNNYVEDCNYNAITLGYSHGITVSENRMTWCSDVGGSQWYSTDCVWQGNIIWNIKKNSGGASNSGWGLACELWSNRTIFDGNNIWNCEKGIALSTSTSILYSNEVTNNIVYDSDTNALSLVNATDSLIDGNTFDSNDAGVLIWIGESGGLHHTENNTFSNNIITNSAGDGVEVRGDSQTFMGNHWLHIGDDAIFFTATTGGDNCSIIGDEFKDVTDIAIEIGSGVSNTFITSCVMRYIGDINEISDAGTNTADHDNYLDEDGWTV